MLTADCNLTVQASIAAVRSTIQLTYTMHEVDASWAKTQANSTDDITGMGRTFTIA